MKSLSTTKAEYKAAAMEAQEIPWLVQLMNYLQQLVDYSMSYILGQSIGCSFHRLSSFSCEN